MRYTIDEMHIQNFRGIRDLQLPVNGQNLIIVGENGAGKSSIVDAIEYGLKRTVEKLTGRQDVNEREGIPFLKKDGDTTVHVTVSGAGGSKDPVAIPYPLTAPQIPPSVEPFFEMAAGQNFILRRSQILRFIEAKGSERYQTISALIGLEHLEAIDSAWRSKKNALKRQVDALEKQYAKALQDAAAELSATINDEQELIQEVNANLQNLGISAVDQAGAMERALEQYQRDSAPDQAKSEQAATLRRYRQYCEDAEAQWAIVAPALEALSTAQDAYHRQLTQLDDATFEQILIQGRQFLQNHLDQRTCPLCETEIDDLPALLSRLDDRLQRLSALTESRQAVQQKRDRLTSSLDTLLARLRDLQQTGASMAADLAVDEVQSAIHEAETWRNAAKAGKTLPTLDVIQRQSTLSRLQTTLNVARAQIEQQLDALSLNGNGEERLDMLFRLQRALRHWKTAETTARELAAERLVQKQFELIYKRLNRVRKNGIDRIQRAIKQDVERFYRMLHPDDARVRVNLPIHNTYNSINMTTSFYEQEAHPLNFYSEGHLDSMGLCIFLAFIARYSKDLKFIVLDDVLTTIDSGHRIRVARLLAREFKDSQIIITTHDRLWAEQLQKALPNSRITRLKPWNLQTGTECLEYVPTWEYYRQQAHNGRPQDAIAGTGRTFEKFLFEMRGRLRLAIPARPDEDYTIGDMYGPFFKWIAKYAPQRHDRPDFVEEIDALEKRLNEVWRLRNWSGAHYNPWGEAVSANDALSFIDEIELLTGAFECPCCKSLVVYNESTGVLHCPECRPSPPPRIVWEYDPAWGEAQMRKLTVNHEAARKGAVIESQKALLRFLRDARRRYHFTVQATPDDAYEIGHLFAPFSEWAARCTLPTIDPPALAGLVDSIRTYITANRWQPVPDGERRAFVAAIINLTGAFHCPHNDCGRLYDYDAGRGQFVCPREYGNDTPTAAQGALWYVKQD